jgi:hypothetical protein
MSEQVEGKDRDGAQRWTFLRRLIVVLVAVVVVVPLAKRAVALDRQIQAVVDAETTALNRGDWQAFEALQDPDDSWFRRTQKSSFDSFHAAETRRQAVAQPALYVVEVERWGDEAWALVMEDPEGDPESGPAEIEFFRRVYGQWLHTGPDPDHWGTPQESQSGQIIWRYREADEGLVAQLAPFAETLHQQVCDDLGFKPDEGQLVNICYSPDCVNVVYPHDRVIELPTLLLSGLDEEGLQYVLANLLTSHLVRRAAGLDARSPTVDSRVLSAIEHWEAAQVTGDRGDEETFLALQQAVADGTLLSLEGLNQRLAAENTALSHAQTLALIDYTVAQYGWEVMPALVRAAGHQTNVIQILQEALGADLDLTAFEVGWLAFIRERYGDGG